MARSKTPMRVTLFSVLFAIIASTGYSQASEKKEECPAKQEISCESLRTTEGFTYPIPMNIPNAGDCEYAWYQNGTCIAHSDGKKSESVLAMTLKNITLITCEDLKWQLDCDNIQMLHCTVDYKVIEPEKEQDGYHNAGLPGWGIAGIVIVIVVIISGAGIALCCRHNHKNRSSY